MDPMIDPLLIQSLFGTTSITPPVMPQPPMVPTGLQPGVPPPPMPMMMPPGPVAPTEPYRTEPYTAAQAPMPIAQPASLGQMLEPMVPTPTARPPEAPGGTYAAGGGPPGSAAAGGGTSKILDSLKGVKAPEAPQAQKVSTPHAPQLRPIQGGGMFDLLAQLGIGPQQALPGLKLPSTLGQALTGR